MELEWAPSIYGVVRKVAAMKKSIALVVAGIVAGAAFVTAFPHRATGENRPVAVFPTDDSSGIDNRAENGYIIRAVGACRNGSGTCVWLQK